MYPEISKCCLVSRTVSYVADAKNQATQRLGLNNACSHFQNFNQCN